LNIGGQPVPWQPSSCMRTPSAWELQLRPSLSHLPPPPAASTLNLSALAGSLMRESGF
jgi:hypothetical protein